MRKKLLYILCSIMVLSLASTSMAEIAAFYPMDEGSGSIVADASGNGHNGTIVGTPTWTDGAPTPNSQTALLFGPDATLGVECGTWDPSAETDELTIACWFKYIIGVEYQGIITKREDWPDQMWQLGHRNDDLYWGSNAGAGWHLTNLPSDEWHHIAATTDGANGVVYLDGEEIATCTAIFGANREAMIRIGHDAIGGVNPFTGPIDEVYIFDSVLSPEEVVLVMEGAFKKPAGSATKPYPENESTEISRDVVLSWTPGTVDSKSDVYFGTNFDDVNDGIGGVTQDANSYDPGRLEFDTTYFWRIDDVNSSDSTVTAGAVWSFTIESLAYPISSERITASASSNEDGKDPQNTVNEFGLDPNNLHSVNVADMWLSNMNDQGPVWIKYELNKVYILHEMLIWNYNGQSVLSMFGLRDVTIEYSTDDSEWTTLTDVPEVTVATGTADYTYNTTIALNGAVAKYVKITANSNWSNGMFGQYGLSEVRFMYIPTGARYPFPEDGATDIALNTNLGWMSGRDAAEHNVYFSDDEQSVIDGTVSAETISDVSYGPLSLDLGTTYYWRVDEVNNVNVVPVCEGDLWQFSTLEYFVVDDFEDYNDYEPDTVWNTWSDGYGIATNGSTAGYPDPNFLDGEHYVETGNVNSGGQSMPMLYDNTGSVNNSEVTRTFDAAQDWTRAGINTLTLYVYGQADNAGGQLYVKVNSIEKAVDVDLTSESWQEVRIDLSNFGVNLQRVTSLAISIRGTGSGMVFIDDVLVGSPLE